MSNKEILEKYYFILVVFLCFQLQPQFVTVQKHELVAQLFKRWIPYHRVNHCSIRVSNFSGGENDPSFAETGPDRSVILVYRTYCFEETSEWHY